MERPGEVIVFMIVRQDVYGSGGALEFRVFGPTWVLQRA